eukprot:7846196-Pyramimonas_sp.AAC.1
MVLCAVLWTYGAMHGGIPEGMVWFAVWLACSWRPSRLGASVRADVHEDFDDRANCSVQVVCREFPCRAVQPDANHCSLWFRMVDLRQRSVCGHGDNDYGECAYDVAHGIVC